jgi:tetratricopeptide (TPR) repeat protein
VPDVLGQGNCAFYLGSVALFRSHYNLAQTWFETAMLLLERAGELQGHGNCLANLGSIAKVRGDNERARILCQDALSIYEQTGDSFSKGKVHWMLAQLARNEDEKRAHCLEAISELQKAGREDLVAQLRSEFGDVSSRD